MKKLFIFALLLFLAISTVFADEWIFCHVVRCGPYENGNICVALKSVDGRINGKWFVANPQIKKEILAVAMFAMATGRSVEVLLTSIAEYGDIKIMYVNDW